MSSGGEKHASARAARPDGAAGSDALERLRAGESTLDEYLDYRADRAVDHLRAVLDEGQLARVKEAVRAELATDPVIAEMIAAAAAVPVA